METNVTAVKLLQTAWRIRLHPLLPAPLSSRTRTAPCTVSCTPVILNFLVNGTFSFSFRVKSAADGSGSVMSKLKQYFPNWSFSMQPFSKKKSRHSCPWDLRVIGLAMCSFSLPLLPNFGHGQEWILGLFSTTSAGKMTALEKNSNYLFERKVLLSTFKR